jgi:hypothetical protein
MDIFERIIDLITDSPDEWSFDGEKWTHSEFTSIKIFPSREGEPKIMTSNGWLILDYCERSRLDEACKWLSVQ